MPALPAASFTLFLAVSTAPAACSFTSYAASSAASTRSSFTSCKVGCGWASGCGSSGCAQALASSSAALFSEYFCATFTAAAAPAAATPIPNNFPQNPIFLRSCLQMLKLEYTGLFLWPMRERHLLCLPSLRYLIFIISALMPFASKKGASNMDFL